jgi:hypothetical protein
MGISLVLATMMLKTALLQAAFVRSLLPPAETAAGIWVRHLIELPIVGAMLVVLTGLACGVLLMVPILTLAAVSRTPFVVAFHKNFMANETPERAFVRRWISLPLLASVCVALSVLNLANGGWSWHATEGILLGSIFLWAALRPQHWGLPD